MTPDLKNNFVNVNIIDIFEGNTLESCTNAILDTLPNLSSPVKPTVEGTIRLPDFKLNLTSETA